MIRLFAGPLRAALGVALCVALSAGCAVDDEAEAGAAGAAPPPDPDPPVAAIVAPALEVCAGCGVARSADYTVIQQIFPFSPTTARSADFTMELLTAPNPEARP